MHIIDATAPRPSDEMVAELGGDANFAQALVDRKVRIEHSELRRAQDFQENVVAKQNEQGFRGADGLGQCVGRIDFALHRRITAKHAEDIKTHGQSKFWLVIAPKLYPELGIKPRYIAKTAVTISKPIHKRFRF
jgi:hypothetical protein